ncbi:DUF6089 family protein [Sungkyunkwania multivorans]|uniref:DUF6089 family protein n=1 Tax=Sungkyunkwania multivorans TaxID=1173618 RepID=A0ABW3D2H8_9FLAO
MRNHFLALASLLMMHVTYAQINEVGLFLGGSNYIGDIGPTDYISPNNVAFGAFYKWNVRSRYSYRASLSHARIEASDLDSDIVGRRLRGLSFENTVTELSAGVEFNFFDFNLHKDRRLVTPYIFTGLSYFGYDALFFENGQAIRHASHKTFAIPIVLGVKTNISRRFILGAEVGARYTFTDALDGSNPTRDKEPFDELKFGNINTDDWYVFAGITLSYTFTQKPCYCAEEE